MTFLLPVDGSESADHAVSYLIRLVKAFDAVTIHLLNVRDPVAVWEVRRFLTSEEITAIQRAEGEAELRSACALLEAAGLPYTAEVRFGAVAQTIADYAVEQGCEAIVMGSHGRGGLANVLMGSVATKVIHLTRLPVTLVR